MCDNAALLFLSGRIGVSGLLAAVALVAVVLGYKLYRGKRGQQDGTLVKWGSLEVRVGAVGAAMMLLAFAVAYWSYRVAPREYRREANATVLSVAPEIPDRARFFVPAGPDKTLSCEKSAAELRCRTLAVGDTCGAAPALAEGIGRLQVARVGHRSSEVRDEVAKNIERSLRKFLLDRGVKDTWGSRLMVYSSPGADDEVVRIVFNGIAPETAGPMCEWLVCEGWTYGPCEFLSPSSR